MGRKKSSYAEKHADFDVQNIVAPAIFTSENKDLLDVMRDPHKFDEKFLQLAYPRQIALIDMFRNIMNGNVIISPRKVKQMLLDCAYDEMERIHWMTGSYYEEGNTYFPIASDEIKLVRMECYGTIDARREHELSHCYKFFKKQENRGKFRLKDYDLQKSPMWRVFNQFESFRSIAPKVRRYLYSQGFNPDVLAVMSVNDFCDIIHQAYAKTPATIKARFLDRGYKNRFVMRFMKACGDDLEEHLLQRKIDERKVKSLCRMMAKCGVCDIDSLTVTEIYFTPRVLADLQKNNYDVTKFKAGDLIPEEFFDTVYVDDNEKLLLARDENGLPLNKDDLPRFEVHHKNAVKFAHSDDYLAKVDYDSNLMLVEREIHRAYYHGIGHIIQINEENERHFSRVNSMIPEMCMINGFNTLTDMFFYNLENYPAAKRRALTDKENVVNYYDMQRERLNNIPQIAVKYGIEYSRIDLNNEYKNLQEITQFKIDVPRKDVKVFEEWYNKKQKKGHKGGKNNDAVPPVKSGNER